MVELIAAGICRFSNIITPAVPFRKSDHLIIQQGGLGFGYGGERRTSLAGLSSRSPS